MSNDRPLSYGEMRPKLEPDDTEGKPCALTIASADRRNMARRGTAPEYKVVVVFAEKFDAKAVRDTEPSEERELVLNASDYKICCAKLGNDEAAWVGKQVVVALTQNKYDGKTYENMHIAVPERWEKVLKASKTK
jgi:hypothetical protein